VHCLGGKPGSLRQMSPTIWPARRKTLRLNQLDAVVVDRGVSPIFVPTKSRLEKA
jgi:hypothetical protein